MKQRIKQVLKHRIPADILTGFQFTNDSSDKDSSNDKTSTASTQTHAAIIIVVLSAQDLKNDEFDIMAISFNHSYRPAAPQLAK